jgi:hypothetical protein
MVKFFKKGPEVCSICGQEKMIYKNARKGLIDLKYCKDCYDEYYARIETRVHAQIKEAVDKGQQIGMKEALAITKTITDEIEAEQVEAVKNGQKNDNIS